MTAVRLINIDEDIDAIVAEAEEFGPGPFIEEMCDLLAVGRADVEGKDWSALSALLLSRLQKFREEQTDAKFARALDNTAPGANLRRSFGVLMDAIGATSFDGAMTELVKHGEVRRKLMEDVARLERAQVKDNETIARLEDKLVEKENEHGMHVREIKSRHLKALKKAKGKK